MTIYDKLLPVCDDPVGSENYFSFFEKILYRKVIKTIKFFVVKLYTPKGYKRGMNKDERIATLNTSGFNTYETKFKHIYLID